MSLCPGDRVLAVFGWANRDRAYFGDEQRVDLRSRTPGQLAFGGGAHTCLGLQLARQELVTVLDELLDRVEAVALVGDPMVPQLRGGMMWGFDRLDVRLTPRTG